MAAIDINKCQNCVRKKKHLSNNNNHNKNFFKKQVKLIIKQLVSNYFSTCIIQLCIYFAYTC